MNQVSKRKRLRDWPKRLSPGAFVVLCAGLSLGAIVLITSVVGITSGMTTEALGETIEPLEDETAAIASASPEGVDPCIAAIQEAANIPAQADANEPLIRSADACSTVDAWVAAVRRYPAAMGLDDAAMVDPEFDLAGICGSSPRSAVCLDAARLGLDTYWGG